MTTDQQLVLSAVTSWKSGVDRASKAFSGASAENLLAEIAPGKNRVIYLWGHLTAVHDRMLPLLGIGNRLHPEFDALFISAPDRSAELPSRETIEVAWGAVNERLADGFAAFSPEDWLRKHTAVSDADFAKDPARNRFAVLLSRTGHLSYHLGQLALIVK